MTSTNSEKLPLLNPIRQRWLPIIFFVLGFVFDAFILRRPDELVIIVHQAIYLLLSAGLVAIELVEQQEEVPPPRLLTRVWRFREPVLHFLMGTLLNAYTIFFFKSASALTSFVFIAVLVGILIINEFKHFGRLQTQFHVGILSLCLICFLANLAPLLWGFIGYLPFISANVVAVLLMLGYRSLMRRRLTTKPEILRTHILWPYLAVQTVFVVLYLARVLPPVPLSASYIGIFHNVQKIDGGGYQLTYTRPDNFFWQNGDESFLARPGDSIYCFVRIFAPSRFKDELQIRWFYDDPKLGWQASDAIALPIVGGRDEGFRGYTRKNNYQPGRWRVQVETKDNREIGRITFRVEADSSLEPRIEKFLID